MHAQETLYPLAFFINATPLSLKAKAASRARWSETVRHAARARIDATDELGFVQEGPFSLTIYYFPSAPMVGDVDNIVKPIMDALIHLAYNDDRSIERVLVQKLEPGVDWSFAQPSAQLTGALLIAPPVVYIRIDDLSWRTA
ncbi:RusA family crossover junction endodeoxyribonuclease [Methylobacterium nonmethylotrophicum]|uniref:RusA family crossover junction endodeoxyribonuclease n=1 Tax=Methylobacterium nonmethylotrophicum TaxID=1141884 RepID=A0A4Z0NLH0_9HYPH|nr:RusA family crossover junction endodeoxyribonuclease [Methylobacterium nonmethylotrophicum]TGD97102.1 RusA family crossover junction endodeoxyribonuclease [Methylobacterium nonmethylotrophicum]